MVVMNSPIGTPALSRLAANARYSASASGMVKTCSMPMWRPGRLPTSTMWLCASMMPGMTVLPRRSITLTRPLRSTLRPTSTKRPFSISTSLTTRFFASMVWMRPLTSASASARLTLRVSRSSSSWSRPVASAGDASAAASSATSSFSLVFIASP